jgi:hypothetical protein
MQKMRKRVNTWLGVTAGLFFLAAVTVGHAAAEPQKGKAVQQPAQGQQLCPATAAGEACKIVLDCPTITAPGKTTCEATIDCPGTKQPVKTKKKPKSE